MFQWRQHIPQSQVNGLDEMGCLQAGSAVVAVVASPAVPRADGVEGRKGRVMVSGQGAGVQS